MTGQDRCVIIRSALSDGFGLLSGLVAGIGSARVGQAISENIILRENHSIDYDCSGEHHHAYVAKLSPSRVFNSVPI